MNNVPRFVVKYILNTFDDVESIILHGSRAAGFAQEHSDWDVIVLTLKPQKQKYYRHEIEGIHFEYKLYFLPIKQEDIFNIFDTQLQFSKLIYDKNDIGKDLLTRAKKFYNNGIPEKFKDLDFKNRRKINRQHIVNNMLDNMHNPAMFMKKIAKIFPQIINEWYWFKKQDYPKNLYISIPEIEKSDIWFSDKLKIIYSPEYSPREKVSALQEVIDYIYE